MLGLEQRVLSECLGLESCSEYLVSNFVTIDLIGILIIRMTIPNNSEFVYLKLLEDRILKLFTKKKGEVLKGMDTLIILV